METWRGDIDHFPNSFKSLATVVGEQKDYVDGFSEEAESDINEVKDKGPSEW